MDITGLSSEGFEPDLQETNIYCTRVGRQLFLRITGCCEFDPLENDVYDSSAGHWFLRQISCCCGAPDKWRLPGWVSEASGPICEKAISNVLARTTNLLIRRLLRRNPRKVAMPGLVFGGVESDLRGSDILHTALDR